MKRFGLILAVSVLAGCASHPQQPQWIEEAPVDGQDGKVKVTTTHGDVQVEPTVVSYAPKEFEDPWESFNRQVFKFNHGLYTYVLHPVAKGYQYIVPDPAERAVSRFFSNLREPLNLINHLGQGEGTGSARNLGRFLINSTLGLAGLFDPADHWFGIPEDVSTLNDTLKHYGVGYGHYLVLPIFGQSDVRAGISTLTEAQYHPVDYLFDSPTDNYLRALNGVNQFAPRLNSYADLYQQAEDPYVFFRNMYLQSLLRDQQFDDQGDVDHD